MSLQVGLLAIRSHTEETLMSLSGGTKPADRKHGNNVGATKKCVLSRNYSFVCDNPSNFYYFMLR